MEKAERTQIHNMIKEVFSSIGSATLDENDKKFIKCGKQNKKSKQLTQLISLRVRNVIHIFFSNEDDRRSRWIWPHEYTYFLMHKENIDTMQAVSSLAPLLSGARASSITYAGTKDKRAKTTQWACIRKREPSLIVRAAQNLRKNIHVGGFIFKDQPLKLGQLKGNRLVLA